MINKIYKKIQFISQKDITKSFGIVFGGSIVTKLLSFITSLLIARALSTNDQGILANLIAITSSLADIGGFTAATMRFTAIFSGRNDKDKINRLVSTTLFNIIAISGIFVIVSALFSNILATYVFKTDISLLIVISAFGLITTLTFNNLYSALHGLKDFKGMFQLTLLFSLERLIPISILFITGMLTIPAVVILYTITPLIPLLYGFLRLRNKHGIKLLPRYDFGLLKEIFHYSKWMISSAILSIVQSRLDQFLLPIFLNNSQAGLFTTANMFVTIFGTLSGSVSKVIDPELAGTDSFEDMKKKLIKTSKLIVILMVLLVGFIIASPIFMVTVLGNKYQDSVVPLIIMLASYVFFIWQYPISGYINSRGKTITYFVTVVVQLTTNIISSRILIPQYGALGSAISFAIVNLVGFLVMSSFFTYYFSKEQRNHAKA